MAEPALAAFGRYLKLLRQRRGLSLDDVEQLTRDLPERVTKTYLSRCENGRQGTALAKLIALSQAYHVPVEVLTERLSLDLELERLGGPETGQLSFAEAQQRARRAARVGLFWDAYAYARDAIELSRQGPLLPGFASMEEQYAAALRNQAIAASLIGFSSFARYELERVIEQGAFGMLHMSRACVALACVLSQVGDERSTLHYARLALETGFATPSTETRAHALFAHGRALWRCGEYGPSLEAHRQALRLYHEAMLPHCGVRTLMDISGSYESMGNWDAAIRLGREALRLAVKHGLRRFAALARDGLGDVLIQAGRPRQALPLLFDAVRVADEFRDFQVAFGARAKILKCLGDLGEPHAEAFAKDLLRLSARVSPTARDMPLFVSLMSERYPKLWVASQRDH